MARYVLHALAVPISTHIARGNPVLLTLITVHNSFLSVFQILTCLIALGNIVISAYFSTTFLGIPISLQPN